MMVVKKFTAKLQIELVSKLRNALLNMLRLYPQILVIIKSFFHTGYKVRIFSNLYKQSFSHLYATNCYLWG